MNVDELCKILKAHEEGKTIEVFKEGFDRKYRGWVEIYVGDHAVDDLLSFQLRIKPEPLEFWDFVWNNGQMSRCRFNSKAEAEADLSKNYTGGLDYLSKNGRVVRFREVLGDE